MSKFFNPWNLARFLAVLAVLAVAYSTKLAMAESDAYAGLGRAATASELKAWDIDVRPDFMGLPKGSGSVAHGSELFEEKCASCHGTFGESNHVFNPLIGGTTKEDIKTGHVKSLQSDNMPQRTSFMKVATLSTLYDYIRRAMPWNAPKSLSNDEVYAVLAYMLNLADIVPSDFVLNDQNIRDVQNKMPNRYGMTPKHALWPGKGLGGEKPDTHNVACMKNCRNDDKIASTLPAYAWPAHGNLAEQGRSVGAVRYRDTSEGGKEASSNSASAPAPSAAQDAKPEVAKVASPPKSEAKKDEGKALTGAAWKIVEANSCNGCHGLSEKIVGPSFKEMATRYKGKDVQTKLLAKLKAGGGGVWGSMEMPPQTASDKDLTMVIKWVLAGATKP